MNAKKAALFFCQSLVELLETSRHYRRTRVCCELFLAIFLQMIVKVDNHPQFLESLCDFEWLESAILN